MTCGAIVKNHWVCNKDSLVGWRIVFPEFRDPADLDPLLQFARRLLEAAERENVFRLLETRKPSPFYADSGEDYADYLARVGQETGKVPFFTLGTGVATTDYGRLRMPAQVCYVDHSGEIVSREVENLGLLLQQLRPADVAEHRHLYMSQVPPLTINANPIRLTGPEFTGRQRSELWIALYSDIWLPWVIGFMDEPWSPETRIKPNDHMYDNRMLADCHTPRLNNFLVAVRELALEIGCTWELDPNQTISPYQFMVSEQGIRLDV